MDYQAAVNMELLYQVSSYMEKNHFSKDEFARACGISLKDIEHIFSRQTLSLDSLVKVCSQLQLATDDILHSPSNDPGYRMFTDMLLNICDQEKGEPEIREAVALFRENGKVTPLQFERYISWLAADTEVAKALMSE